jgi:hypothetical protein
MGSRWRVAAAVALLVAALGPAARADVIGGANVRVGFHGWLSPRQLPRHGTAPVALHVKGSVHLTHGGTPPDLDRVRIEVNRHAAISTAGLPACRPGPLLATTSKQALEACRPALIGDGLFRAHIAIPEQAPFPAHGRMLAFNSVSHGRHVILVHVFGRHPVPTGQVLTLSLRRAQGGTFGTVLSLKMPAVAAAWGHVTGFSLTLHRLYRFRGSRRSLISASCPAPSGFSSAVFPAARGTYFLGDGRTIRRLVSGTCHVVGS